MDELIKYLVEEKKQNNTVAQLLTKQFDMHEDIKNACIEWVKTRQFTESISINGYTDKKLYEINPDLDGFGVYKLMITLRENPDKVLQYINSNFSKK